MNKLVLFVSLGIALLASPSIALQAQAPFGLAFSSYYGQFGHDEATDVTVDANGFVYVTGATESFGFPSTGFDAFVLKLTPDGSQIVYSTYLRGSGFDIANAIAVDATGTVYVVGHTTSSDFPLLTPFQSVLSGDSDVWIAKLDASGALTYSSYYGGSSFENGYAMALGASGEVYIAGSTGSPDLPAANGLQQTFGGGFEDAFVVKIRADGSGTEYATYLGGSASDGAFRIAVDAQGAVSVGGSTASFDFPIVNAYQPFLGGGFADAFLARFQPDGLGLTFSTFLGGQGDEAAVRLVVDSQGNLHLAGETGSVDFPLIDAIQQQVNGIDGFVVELSGDGQTLMRSTPLGGTGLETIVGLALSPTSEVWLAGRTDSEDFPVVNPFQPSHGGSSDAFVTRLGVAPPPNQPPVAFAGDDVQVTADGCMAQVLLNGTGSNDPEGDPLTFEWLGEFGTVTGATATVELTPGTHTITLRVHDGRGGSATDTVVVTVLPAAPPQIVSVTATPNVLSPADHQMVPVVIDVNLTGGCVAGTTCTIVSVSSSEPTSGLGRHDLAPDWEVTGPLTLLLRAEHAPGSRGRLYTVVVECVHASGETVRRLVFVTVPRR